VHRLRPEGLDFTTTAPRRWTFSAPVAARPAEVFAALCADPSTWVAWFPGLSAGHYEGDQPPGLGSGREVTVGRTRYRETVIAWDAPRQWAYRVDETTAPMANALVEVWDVAPDGDDSVVSWTFAIDPRPLFAAVTPLASPVMGALFRRAMRNLSRRLAHPT
jgi:carbon monoxide dehydrogenase subunit G